MNSRPGPGGCKDPIREAWALRYGLSIKVYRSILTSAMCWQLARCKDDESRRIILGVKVDS